MNRSGPCVFCENDRKYTQEHVIPQWVRRILKTGPVEITDRAKNERLRFDQTLTLVVNGAFCRDCNNGHMKQLGERVKPDVSEMIVGERVVLTPIHSRVLSAWAVERVLLLGLALNEAREAKRDVPQTKWVGDKAVSSFRWLYAHRDEPTPPPGIQVWIAYRDARANLPAWSVIGTWPESLEEPDGYLCGFSIGCVMFIVFGQDFGEADNHAPDGRSLGRLELPGRFGGYVVPIWPDPNELVVWPTAFGFSDADLGEIARLFTISTVRRRKGGSATAGTG